MTKRELGEMNGSIRFFTLIVATLFAGVMLAADPDPRPASFFGTVTVDGNPVADGTLVSASIGGTEFAAATTFTDAGLSVYRLDVPGDNPTTPQVEGGVDGQTVVFRIEGSDAPETGAWLDGAHVPVDLTGSPGTDLSLTKDDGVAVASPGESLT